MSTHHCGLAAPLVEVLPHILIDAAVRVVEGRKWRVNDDVVYVAGHFVLVERVGRCEDCPGDDLLALRSCPQHFLLNNTLDGTSEHLVASTHKT